MPEATLAIVEDLVRDAIHPLRRSYEDYDHLLSFIGDARLVLLGEASHGTHEFYRERAQITKRLVLEKGFTAVAVEADWPDAYRVNRWVRGQSMDQDGAEALSGFRRFPAWMWRNADVLDFIGWLRTHRACDRRNLSAGIGVDQPLLSCATLGSVRCHHSLR